MVVESALYSPFQTESEALDYLYGLGASVMKLGTERMQKILEYLGNPQDRVKTIHVVGTNGKGSVCATLASIYNAAGYKTGLYISPHLVDVHERIQLTGHPVSSVLFLAAAQQIYHAMTQVLGDTEYLTFFEFINAMAFWVFAKEEVDIAIIEAGLGGRLDSTNTIQKPLAVVVTPISLDHTDRLGGTLQEIAQEKAGVFRSGVPVFSATQTQQVKEVLVRHAVQLNAPFLHSDFPRLACGNLETQNTRVYRAILDHKTGDTYQFGLLGRYQHQNLEVMLRVVEYLAELLPISDVDLKQGLRQADWPGRFQYFPHRNLIIDGSHNEAGIESLLETLQMDFPEHPVHFGISLLKNRELRLVEPLLRYPQTIAVDFLLTEAAERFHTPADFKDLLGDSHERMPIRFGTSFRQFCETPDAKNALRIVTGSLYTAGAVLKEMSKTVT
jgi:dihydrofolate synthase / folylpolyglutamate synthase